MSATRDAFTHRAMVVVGLVMLAVLIATIVALAVDVLFIFFGAALLAVFLRGIADLISAHTRLGPRAALMLVLLVFAAAVATSLWLLVTEVSDQIDRLGSSLQQGWQQMQNHLRGEVWGRQLLALLSQAQTDGGATDSDSEQDFGTTLGAPLNFAVIIFMSVYFAMNPGWYRRGLLRLFSPAQRTRARELLDAIGHTLRWWLFGRAVGMTVVGIVTTTGLLLLDVPLAFGLGLLAAALDFVPFVGPLVAAAPAIMIALGEGPMLAAYVALLYLAIQITEGYVVTPLIEQRSVHLPPALTIGTQVMLAVLVGAVGIALATPLAAVLVVLIKRLYVEDTLEHKRQR